VTVCVAAICDGRVVGASDRMLTAGDIEFEPEASKLRNMNNAIGAMLAGNTAMQSEIMGRLTRETYAQIESNRDEWLRVEDVANQYYKHYLDIKRERSEQRLLHPLGLDGSAFLEKQKQMDTNLIDKLAKDLVNFEMPAIEAIFAGIDGTGPHIYTVRNNGVSCQDWAGFASIGVGAWHADSQLMIARHTRQRPMPETLLLIYSAKKRAEVAPGVGQATDMFLTGPGVGGFIEIGGHVLQALQENYETMNEEFMTSRQKADERIAQYVHDLTSPVANPEQSSIPSGEADLSLEPNEPSEI